MNPKDKYIVISATLQLAAIIPLFAIALSFGRMVEKIDAHEKRLDRIESKVLSKSDKMSGHAVSGAYTVFHRDTLQTN